MARMSKEMLLSFKRAAAGRKGGRKSGAARLENIPAKKRKEIARRAAKARWGAH